MLLWRGLEIGWKSNLPEVKLGWTAKEIDTVANFPRWAHLANHTLAHKLGLRGTVQGFQNTKRCLIVSVNHIYISSEFSYTLLLTRHVANVPSECTIDTSLSLSHSVNAYSPEHIWNCQGVFFSYTVNNLHLVFPTMLSSCFRSKLRKAEIYAKEHNHFWPKFAKLNEFRNVGGTSTAGTASYYYHLKETLTKKKWWSSLFSTSLYRKSNHVFKEPYFSLISYSNGMCSIWRLEST